MAQTGAGEYRYELIRDFLKLPEGQNFGLVSRVAADAQDRIYVFQRKNPPVVVFDRDDRPPQWRPLRDRRLPQRPRAPLHAGRPAREIMGCAGPWRRPVPPAAQHSV